MGIFDDNLPVADNATETGTFEEQPADDARDADVVSAEDFMPNNQNPGTETDESSGDAGHDAEDHASSETSEKKKFEARIAAALANQRQKYQPDADFAGALRRIAPGMTDEQIIQSLREHQARVMHEQDADISEKAAKLIIKEREGRIGSQRDATDQGSDQTKDQGSDQQQEILRGLTELRESGWEDDELRAFSLDPDVQKNIAGGMSIARAANKYLREMARASEKRPAKRAVPTSRSTAYGEEPDGISQRIENMSDAEFAKFSRRMQEEMMSGKKIRF